MPRIHRVENFTHGIVDSIEKKSIPAGSASRSLNWLTLGDRIELRRGYKRLGGDDGTGQCSSVFSAPNYNGDETLFKTYARKVKYLTEASAWVEMGSNHIPVAGSGEDVFWGAIKTQAGAQAWFCSPNGIFTKVMMNSGTTTVPPTIVDVTNTAKNFTGRIRIKRNRIYLFGRATDRSGFNGSYIDARAYTTVTAESIGTGNGATKDYSGTLAFKGGGTRRSCFAVTFTDGTESFSDNRDGTLTGSAGGTGTINYATGAYAIHFNANVINLAAITSTYQHEDSSVTGIADFTESGTRTAGQGFYLPQGEGGDLETVQSYNDSDFCMHETTIYKVELTNDDTNATNEVYRVRAGIPSPRAAVGTGDGIYYVDNRTQSDAKVRLLTFDSNNAQVVPVDVSLNLDLSGYRFDRAVVFEWDIYIVIACHTPESVDSSSVGVNNRMLMYNRKWKSWDVVDFYANDLTILNGALVAADTLSNNALELFSGFDDDGNTYDNYWESNLDEQKIAELKKSRTVRINGLIQPDQNIEVYLSIEDGDFFLLDTIEGDGAYVDASGGVSVGMTTVGKKVVGGSNDADAITAYNYYREINVRRTVDKYQRVKIKFVATGLGYASVSSYEFFDIELMGSRIPARYNV